MCFVLFCLFVLPNQPLKMSANAKPALPGYITTERDFGKRNSISWLRIAMSLLLDCAHFAYAIAKC